VNNFVDKGSYEATGRPGRFRAGSAPVPARLRPGFWRRPGLWRAADNPQISSDTGLLANLTA
jgi:hypothetical protein